MPRKKLRLAGLTEIAQLAEMTKQGAERMTNRPDFPDAIDTVAAGSFWDRQEVEEYVAARKRKKAETTRR